MSTRAKVAIILVLVAAIVGLIIVDSTRGKSSTTAEETSQQDYSSTPDLAKAGDSTPASNPGTGLPSNGNSSPSGDITVKGTPSTTTITTDPLTGTPNTTTGTSQDPTGLGTNKTSQDHLTAKPMDNTPGSQNNSATNPLSQQPTAQGHNEIQPTSETKTHKVQKNDNFWDLAKHYYGDGSKFKLIQEANPGKNSGNLKIGDELVIPAAPMKSTDPVHHDALDNGLGHGGGSMDLPATYEVKKGDNLTAIAIKFYKSGAPKFIEKIVKANSLKNPNSLKVGMKLTIPQATDGGFNNTPNTPNSTPDNTPSNTQGGTHNVPQSGN